MISADPQKGVCRPGNLRGMLDDSPRVFFVHYWANDDAVKLAKALRAALDALHVASKG